MLRVLAVSSGEMSEWFKELVLKTSDPARGRGFESHSLRHFLNCCEFDLEKYPRGRRGSPAKGVGRETGARVQIPPSAPKVPHLHLNLCKCGTFLLYLFENLCFENPRGIMQDHAESGKNTVYC